MKIINKIIRKITGGELAQEQQLGRTIGGKPNENIVPLLRQAGTDGCVLLKNEKNTLPFTENDNVAVFGRVQYDYFFVGNGSGGDVLTPYKINLIEGIENNNAFKINEELKTKYKLWSDKNQVDPGFWGHWPRFYPEMPISASAVKKASCESNKALVVIGRSAGEDRENALSKGSFYLTDREIKMLDIVTKYFDKVAVILNIGSIIDFEKLDSYGDRISAVMIVWQSGMESGNSVADVLSGKVSPSGKLADTVAKKYEAYPSNDNFGAKNENKYIEDIYMGYRYFETFKPEDVSYEFGFGLSYTQFETKLISAENNDGEITVKAEVKNTGEATGKEVLQLYASAPQAKLGKPAKVLIGFKKTKQLAPLESQVVEIKAEPYSYSSYDDSNNSGNKNSYVLEEGQYKFYLGTSVKKCEEVLSYELKKTRVLETLTEVMAVKEESQFRRFLPVKNGKGYNISYENVPTATTDLKQIILDNMPESKNITGDRGYKLKDVKDGRVSLDDFVAQLSLDELELISRGEGMMGSKLGAEGNAGVLAGVSETLREKGIPAITTTDGPSGIRLSSSCSLMPCGTALACTWDTELVETLFTEMGKEMVDRGSDVLLAPGMNIHRNPLCGRNFEYYSEDPLLSGKMAVATVKGIQSVGVSACPKHFACNNQEYNRNYNNSILSERALREIYLKGFEICIKEASPKNIMTSYNKINGVWSHYNYELCTTVLRSEWGYKGSVMTDWWMRYAASPEFPEVFGNAYRVRAQVDVLMPGAKTVMSKTAEPDGTLLETYGKENGITLGELQRTAKNVLNFALDSNRMN